MPITSPRDREFERLANEFLAKHPEVQREWREEHRSFDKFTSLICGVDQPNEVFASLDRAGQIAVGLTTGDHEDFEGYSGDSDEKIARAAFDYFVDLLRANGHLAPVA